MKTDLPIAATQEFCFKTGWFTCLYWCKGSAFFRQTNIPLSFLLDILDSIQAAQQAQQSSHLADKRSNVNLDLNYCSRSLNVPVMGACAWGASKRHTNFGSRSVPIWDVQNSSFRSLPVIKQVI